MSTTRTWAESLRIATEADLPAVANYSRPFTRTAQQVATRAVILQGVVAVAYGVGVQPVIEWFQAQAIWDAVTPQERAFFGCTQPRESERIQFQWKQARFPGSNRACVGLGAMALIGATVFIYLGVRH